MKTINIYIISILVLCAFSACSDYLDRDSDTDTSLNYDDIFKDKHAAPGFINNAYNYLPVGFYRTEDALFASATDEAKHSEGGSLIQLFNNNAISTSTNPDNAWVDMYKGIRICNIFLKELDPNNGLIVKYNSIDQTPSNKARDNFRGQALFLRAFFHFELLKRYQNIFCVNEVLDSFKEDEIYDIPQSTYEEAVEFIVNDCDSAYKYLPETLVDETLGRPSKAAPLALKSRLLLYAASALNNPDNDKAKWARAEAAAKDLYDKASTPLKLALLDKGQYAKIFTTPYNEEVIFATKAENTQQIEKNNFPISYQGKGLTNPTQDLVDSYVMTSTTYAEPMRDYDPANPYGTTTRLREDRFYATILYNNATFKGSKVETFVGGKDGLYSTSTATKTGYYLRKFVSADIDLSKVDALYRSWVLFRYAETILNYAEARNEVLDSPANDQLIHDLLNLIRNRAGLRPFRTKSEYITSKDEMRKYIRKERRVEFAMEEHRFWDLRRWKDIDALKAPVRGVRIERTQDGVDVSNNPVYKFSYEYFQVEKREFDTKFYWYPIPRAEILKYRNRGINIQQNPGWE